MLTKQDSLAEADTLLRGALAIRRKLFGENNDATAQSLDHLAALFNEKDDFPNAEPLYRSALRLRRELRGWSGSLRGCRAALSTGAGIDRQALGTDHRNVASILNDLGRMLFSMGRLDEADSLSREALAIDRRLFGENPAVSSNLSNLALVVRERGEFDEAEKLLEQALAIDCKLYGADHVSISFYLSEIAVVLRVKGRPDSAAVLLRQALAIDRKLQGNDDDLDRR